MCLKTVKIIATISIFLLCFPFHFVYDWLPNGLTSIFFPVNESIWEHMKLIAIPYFLFGIVEYIILTKNKIKPNNFLLQLFLVPLLGIILYLLIYLPLYSYFGENMFISIALLLFIIILMEIASYYLLKQENIKYQSIIGTVGIIAVLITFGYLTYKPIENYVFYDTEHNKYGINIYQKS